MYLNNWNASNCRTQHLLSRSVDGVVHRFIKGKNAISIARRFMGRAKSFTGENFWARDYFVSTVGLDEEMVRAYIRHQGKGDERYNQLKLEV